MPFPTEDSGSTDFACAIDDSTHEFKAQCSDKTVWDIEIQSKRTGFNPKGNWEDEDADL